MFTMFGDRACSNISGDPQWMQKLRVLPGAASLKRLISSSPSMTRNRLRQLPT
jgi:hypothetical protein